MLVTPPPISVLSLHRAGDEVLARLGPAVGAGDHPNIHRHGAALALLLQVSAERRDQVDGPLVVTGRVQVSIVSTSCGPALYAAIVEDLVEHFHGLDCEGYYDAASIEWMAPVEVIGG